MEFTTPLPRLPDPRERDELLRQLRLASPELAGMLDAGMAPARALANLGLRCIREARFADAVPFFSLAVGYEPDQPDGWTNWGIALDRGGRPQAALACYESALRLRPRHVETWLLMGLAKRKLHDPAGAEEAYRSALAREPESAAAWQCLASLKEELHQEDEAIACLLRSLKAGAVSAAACANLGKLFFQNCRIDSALAAYQDALQLEPGNAHYQRMLRDCRFLKAALDGLPLGPATDAVRAWVEERGGDADAELRKLLETAIALASGFGHIEPASQLVAEYLRRWPEHAEMQYLMAALRADKGLVRSPEAYLVSHFDAFAASFDNQLIGRLGYAVPTKIAAMLDALLPASRALDVLDVGCGTGLCGPLLRPWARRLVGVDIAPKMIEAARQRGVYDQLTCAELISALDAAPAAFDLIVAADVLIYFGDLAPVLAAAARALREGGHLAFSTECHAGDGYRVLPTGRFAHAKSYILGLAEGAYAVEACGEEVLRLHAGKPLPGNLFVLRRKPTG